MDTLFHDLHNLCFGFLNAAEHVWLNFDQQNNEPYLSLISDIDRIYLAFKQNSYPWILQLGSNNKIDPIFYIDKAYKYKHHWIIKDFQLSYTNVHYQELKTQSEESILAYIREHRQDVGDWSFMRLLIKKSYTKCIDMALDILDEHDLILYMMFDLDRFDLIERYFKPIPRETQICNTQYVFFRYYVIEKDERKVAFCRKYYKCEVSLLFSFLYDLYHLDNKDIILDKTVLLSESFWHIISVHGSLPLLKKTLKLADSMDLLEKMMKLVYRILQYNNLSYYFSIEKYMKMNIDTLQGTCCRIGLKDYHQLDRLDLIKLLIDYTY